MQAKAAALSYDNKHAPKVIASGKGILAQKIIEKAQEFSIPLFANESLVNSLVELDIDKEIPAELYQTVVEVFIWLMKNESKI